MEVKLIPRELKELSFPVARFLTLEEQEKYEEACKSFGVDVLNIGLKGSNLFKVLLLNQIGIKTATLPELDLIVEDNSNFLKGTYEDAPSVVLRSAGDSYKNNDYLAKFLARLINKKKFPHAVVIEGLKIKKDNNSAYKLSFEKGENFNVVEAPDFDYINNQKRFEKINPDYTIEFDNKGTGTFYAKEDGLSRLCFVRNLDLNSWVDDLGNSYSGGRIVVVCGEATQKLNEYYASFKKQKEEYDSGLRKLITQIQEELKR